MKLIIAEKPSLARNIVNAIGNMKKKDGYFENDEYLNSIKDISEKNKYSDINEETNINLNQPEHKENIQIAKPFKKDAVKESIFEIYAENNLLELNKIIVLLNKLNNIYLTKNMAYIV